ncbi:MAG: photosystem II protein Y [Prochlorococcus sp.]
MDARLFLVAAPILIALTWAAINIGQAAIGQFKMMLNGGES